MQSGKNKCFAAIAALACSSASPFGHAQGAEASAGSPSSTGTPILEEVVVSALRRGEATALMDTPLAVSSMSGVQLEAEGITSVMDALRFSPGVSALDVGAQGSAVAIRGVSGTVGDATIGYYLDDLPFTRVGQNVSPDLNPYDLDRIEVLRGPQGTIFGAGSVGGTVRILTKDPVLNELSGKGTAAYSETSSGSNGNRFAGAVNIPLVDDTLAVRLVASQTNAPGYIDRPLLGIKDYNEDEDTQYRAKLLFRPNDAWTLKASAWHTENDSYNVAATEDFEMNTAWLQTDPATFTPDFTVPPIPAPPEWAIALNETDIYNVYLERTGDSVLFSFSSSFLENTSFQTYDFIPVAGLSLDFENETTAHEFRLASLGSGPFSWNAGVIYLDMEMTRGGTTTFFLSPAGTEFPIETDRARQTSEQWAVYGEGAYALSDTWELTLGGRFVTDDREITDLAPAVVAGLEAAGIPVTRSESFDQFTGKVNLAYRPSDFSMFYAQISQGFRAGPPNSGAAILQSTADGFDIPVIAAPDEMVSYELGAKMTLLDGDLLLEAALYRWDWEDILTLLSYVTNAGTFQGYTANAAEARGQGIDVGITYAGIEGLTLSFSGNFGENEYLEDLPEAGIVDGDPFVLAPDVTWTATAAYRIPVGRYQGVVLLNASYLDERTDYSIGFSNTSDETTLVNGRIGIERNSWGLFLTGENLLDEDGSLGQLAAGAQFGLPQNRYRPRTIGIEFNLSFE